MLKTVRHSQKQWEHFKKVLGTRKDRVEIHLGVRDVSASGDRALLLWQRAKLTPTPLHSLVCCENANNRGSKNEYRIR
jgi:hypothetical protein